MKDKLYYFNNAGERVALVDEADIITHNQADDAHKDLFAKYTLKTPIGLFDAAHNLGYNYKVVDQSTYGFAKLGSCIITYTSDKILTNQPSQFGQLLNFPTVIDSDDARVTQLWFDTSSGDLYTRTGTKANPIGNLVFDKLYLKSDAFDKAGTEFPGSSLTIGMFYYRTDEKKLYMLESITDNTPSWSCVANVDVDAGVATKLANPWWHLDNYKDDTSIGKLAKNTDLNTITSPDCYTSPTVEVTNSLINCPYKDGNFRLVVQENVPGWGMQLLYAGNSNSIYTRGFTRNVADTEYIFTLWEKNIKSTDTISKAVTAESDSDGNSFSTTYAKIDSPNFKGTPTTPTPANTADDTQIANTKFVQSLIKSLSDTAPTTLNTLAKIAEAINNDPNFSTTINTAINNVSTTVNASVKSVNTGSSQNTLAVTYNNGSTSNLVVNNVDNATKWNNYTLDPSTENTSDTWLLVFNNDKVQHCTIQRILSLVNNTDIDSYGGDFIRYKNGTQICWKVGTGTRYTWTYPRSFSSKPAATGTCNSGDWCWLQNLSTTSVTFRGDSGGNIIAIGRWK